MPLSPSCQLDTFADQLCCEMCCAVLRDLRRPQTSTRYTCNLCLSAVRTFHEPDQSNGIGCTPSWWHGRALRSPLEVGWTSASRSTWPIWNTATSTAAGPQVFESMSVGPLSCLKMTAVWRAADLHTLHASPRGLEARHLVLSPSLPPRQSPLAMEIGSRKSAHSAWLFCRFRDPLLHCSPACQAE